MSSPTTPINCAHMLIEPFESFEPFEFLQQQDSRPCWLYRDEFYNWMDQIKCAAPVMTPTTSTPDDGPQLQPVNEVDSLRDGVESINLSGASLLSNPASESARPGDYEVPDSGGTGTTLVSEHSSASPTAVTNDTRPYNLRPRPCKSAGAATQHARNMREKKSANPATRLVKGRGKVFSGRKALTNHFGQIIQAHLSQSDSAAFNNNLSVPSLKINVTCIGSLSRVRRAPRDVGRLKNSQCPTILLLLYTTLKAINKKTNFVPREVKDMGDSEEIKLHLDLNKDDDINDFDEFTSSPTTLTLSALRQELGDMIRIATATELLMRRRPHEIVWNHAVHSAILQQLRPHFPQICISPVHNTKPQAQYLPSYGTYETQAKLVDYVILYEPDDVTEQNLIQLSITPEHPSINHVISTDPYFVKFPMVIPVETKSLSSSSDSDMAVVQVVLWAMSQFNRYRKIAGPDKTFTFPIPMLIAVGNVWTLYFAIDGEENTDVMRYGTIGCTDTLTSCYQLLESLKAIMKFVMDQYLPLFTAEVLSFSDDAHVS